MPPVTGSGSPAIKRSGPGGSCGVPAARVGAGGAKTLGGVGPALRPTGDERGVGEARSRSDADKPPRTVDSYDTPVDLSSLLDAERMTTTGFRERTEKISLPLDRARGLAGHVED